MFFSGSVGSFLLGFGAGFFSREAYEFGKKNLSPVMKNASEASKEWFEKGKESLAHLQENFEDLVAEFKAHTTQPEKPETAKKKKAPTKAKGKAKNKAKVAQGAT